MQETWVGKIPWRRLPTPIFWPGEFHGLYSSWDRKELDMTERLSLHFKEKLTTVFLKLLQKIDNERTLPNSFYVTNITLIPKPDKDITRKKN